MSREARNRLAEERKDLRTRRNKLEVFITTDRFKYLKRKSQKLLKKQLRIMNRLYDVITERLENFEN